MGDFMLMPNKQQILDALPDLVCGMTVSDLIADYRRRLFDEYLPFWDKGGLDKERGGVFVELNDDGSVQADEKFVWYQARNLWIYARLYNELGGSPAHLAVARKTGEFMLEHMYEGDGSWRPLVTGDGQPCSAGRTQGVLHDVYESMFPAAGFVELFRASGDEQDLEIARACIRRARQRYEDPGYAGIVLANRPGVGLRAQGHSFMFVWPISQLLRLIDDNDLEVLLAEHVEHIVDDFWNAEYGFANEYLDHDYGRISQEAARFFPGHSLEAMWMVMEEAQRKRDDALYSLCKERFQRMLELAWDDEYEGIACTNYDLFPEDGRLPGPDFSIKTMWAQVEAMQGCMIVFEHTREEWALRWYERIRSFVMRTLPTATGVWRQAVDRRGMDKVRAECSTVYRRGNFHQPRYMMHTVQALERMLQGS